MKRLIFLHLLIPLLTTCYAPQHQQETAGQDPAVCHTHEATTLASAPLPEMSLYQLESRWTNQNGQNLELKDLKGKIQLVAMVYTSCSYACPRIVADLQRIEDALQTDNRKEVGIILVTLDPDRDTPEKLLEFAAKNNLDPNRWMLLTSTDSNIRELAALLNVRYQQSSNKEISHSNIISVLDVGGEVVHQQEGLGVDPDETVKSIKQLLKL